MIYKLDYDPKLSLPAKELLKSVWLKSLVVEGGAAGFDSPRFTL